MAAGGVSLSPSDRSLPDSELEPRTGDAGGGSTSSSSSLEAPSSDSELEESGSEESPRTTTRAGACLGGGGRACLRRRFPPRLPLVRAMPIRICVGPPAGPGWEESW